MSKPRTTRAGVRFGLASAMMCQRCFVMKALVSSNQVAERLGFLSSGAISVLSEAPFRVRNQVSVFGRVASAAVHPVAADRHGRHHAFQLAPTKFWAFDVVEYGD